MGAGWQFCWGSNRLTGGGGGGAWEPAQAPSKLPITLHTGPCICNVQRRLVGAGWQFCWGSNRLTGGGGGGGGLGAGSSSLQTTDYITHRALHM